MKINKGCYQKRTCDFDKSGGYQFFSYKLELENNPQGLLCKSRDELLWMHIVCIKERPPLGLVHQGYPVAPFYFKNVYYKINNCF